ncbi:trimeric intracellular cation channel family protein [Haladaptatus sp. DFWS20]|uniref:trimeric intracellular cation channel family protein n=1 Tax=Haladaptatus sp. DFWS20 TaxID=3403467 RepID=UPI003EBA7B25
MALTPPLAETFTIANAIGLVAFALVGASKGIREEFDPFGVLVVGLVTAFGGGAMRDILVGRLPLSLQQLSNVGFALMGVALAILLSVLLETPDRHPISIGADAAGLAAFTTAGALVAVDTAVSPFGLVAVATINAVGGGAYADILLDRSPFILLRGFYASCAVLGGVAFWVVVAGGFGTGTAAIGCAITVFCTRSGAIHFGMGFSAVSTMVQYRDNF